MRTNIRIRTMRDSGHPMGMHTFVELVKRDDSGNEVEVVPIQGASALQVVVSDRCDYVTAALVVRGVELDVEAQRATVREEDEFTRLVYEYKVAELAKFLRERVLEDVGEDVRERVNDHLHELLGDRIELLGQRTTFERAGFEFTRKPGGK